MKNLDEIILARRTIRSFTSVAPSEEQIKSLLRAGLHAPYAALAVQGSEKYRQFIVIGGQGENAKIIKKLVKEQTTKFSKIIPFLNIFLKNKVSKAFKERLKTDLMGNAPWYIIVAEPKGFPPVSSQSIAHCMQNMWLKATEIGLGFRLLSVFENMNKNTELCKLLSLEKGKYAINCCAVGCSEMEPENSTRSELENVTNWIE